MSQVRVPHAVDGKKWHGPLHPNYSALSHHFPTIGRRIRIWRGHTPAALAPLEAQGLLSCISAPEITVDKTQHINTPDTDINKRLRMLRS